MADVRSASVSMPAKSSLELVLVRGLLAGALSGSSPTSLPIALPDFVFDGLADADLADIASPEGLTGVADLPDASGPCSWASS